MKMQTMVAGSSAASVGRNFQLEKHGRVLMNPTVAVHHRFSAALRLRGYTPPLKLSWRRQTVLRDEQAHILGTHGLRYCKKID